MNKKTDFAPSISARKICLSLAVGLSAMMITLPLICAEQRGASRPEASKPVTVDRSSHGSIHHVDTHVVQRPVEARQAPEHNVVQRPVEERRAPEHSVAIGHGVVSHVEALVHRDVEVDVHRPHFWNDFAFGRHLAELPLGFMALQISGAPYFYSGGIYYQSIEGGYQEVYPPVGAAVPQPPDGAIEIDIGGQAYYYAGGAFYLQQPDGTYAIVPTPMGAVVPELPPGAVQTFVRGSVAYQFNGIYYEPTFVNGVTQYETFVP
jgi:hypothetical protein